MVSRLSKQTRGGIAVQSAPSDAETGWASQVDPEMIYRMIDSILPFEACLYHQILPLSLEGSCLKLGMVNSADASALDYVRRILAYMNCSLVPQPISAETHQAMLSAYLKRKQPKSGKNQTHDGAATSTPTQEARNTEASTIPRGTRPTLIVNSPEELEFADLDIKNDSNIPADHHDSASPPVRQSDRKTLILDSESPSYKTSQVADATPILQVEAHHLFEPIEVLLALSPKNLLHELLARVLLGGIGRLYLERQPQQGRVLWSQNGILQSVLQDLNIALFQGLINELKRLAYLPLISVQQARQVEFERLYKQERLLLRLRVMPGEHGEEATLQVLRGAALKFHQQQQLSTLGRDALNIAQQLQRKLSEIRERTQLNPSLSSEQLEALTALELLLNNVNKQLDALKNLKNT